MTSPRVRPRPHRLDRQSSATRRIPRTFWFSAGFWGLVTILLSFPPPQVNLAIDQYDLGTTDSLWTQLTGLTSSMWIYTLMSALAAVAAALAPALALRWPAPAVVLAFLPSLPLGMFMYSPGLPLRLATFTALLGVAMSAMHRSIRSGWIFGAMALIVPAAFTFWSGTRLWTAGTSGVVQSQYWEPSKRLISFAMYATGTALVLGTATALVMSSRLRDEHREMTQRAAVVDERAALARDLHDVVAHLMSLVAVRAETAPYSHPEMSAETRAVLADIAADARGALAEMRDVLGVLRDENDTAPLRPQPSAADIATLVEEARTAGTCIEVIGEFPPADALTGNTLYRIVQEALTNARRHAPNAPVTVTFTDAPDEVRAVIANPAPGTGVEAGRGLTGMRERVERTGGRLSVAHGEKLHDTDATGSFVVDATLPRSSS